MKIILAVAAAMLLGLNGPLLAQDDFNPMNEVGQTMNAIFKDGNPNPPPPPPSVTETLSSGWTEVVGNDVGEGVLLQGVEKLGCPELALVPVADGSQVLGHLYEKQYKDAADKAVPTAYGSLFGWAAAWWVGEVVLEGGAVVVGGITAPGWVPALVVGVTVGWATKQAADWMLHPPSNNNTENTVRPVRIPTRPPNIIKPPCPHPGGG